MQTYLELAEFCKLVHLNEDAVKGMIANGSLNFKEEDGKIYIEANQGTFSVVPSGTSEAAPISSISLAGESFVEKTIGTILNLHEKVLDAKDETLDTLKNENKFLKDALYSMQDIYDEDRKTIDILNEQLARAQEEVEFLKRKYKLMWNKAVDNFTQGKDKASVEELKDEFGEIQPNEAQNTPNSATQNSQSSQTSAINAAKAAQSVATPNMTNSPSGASAQTNAPSTANPSSATTQSAPNSANAQNATTPNSAGASAPSNASPQTSTANLGTTATPSANSTANLSANSATNATPNSTSTALNSNASATLNANSSVNSVSSANSAPNSTANVSVNSSATPAPNANSATNSSTNGVSQ